MIRRTVKTVILVIGSWIGFNACFGIAALLASFTRKPAPHPVDCLICELYAERTPAPVEVVPA